jgi:hypothetical protein
MLSRRPVGPTSMLSDCVPGRIGMLGVPAGGRSTLLWERPGDHMTDYLVVLSDCHAGPPPTRYCGYMNPKYRQQYDDFLRSLDEMRVATTAAKA